MQATLLALSVLGASVHASSHSEAPGTAKGPRSDLSDVYAFQSSADTTTLVMNVSPLQRSDAGPNYNPLDSNYIYQFHVDNDGDRIEDITFQFLVGSKIVAPKVPLGVVGTIKSTAGGDHQTGNNILETYQARVLRGQDYASEIENGPFLSRVSDGAVKFFKPIDNVGEKTFSEQDYETYANNFVQNVKIPGCSGTGKLFVGPRRESFSINLGAFFDLINIPEAASEEGLQLGQVRPDLMQKAKFNTLDCNSVVSFVIEVPTVCLTASDTVIGAWASVRKVVHTDAGHVVGEQVTRLGNPLFNELFIGLSSKDKFGSSQPKNDKQWREFATKPTIPAIIKELFGIPQPVGARGDLEAVLLTGIPGLNRPAAPPVRKRNVEGHHDDDDDSDEISTSDIVADQPLIPIVPNVVVPEPAIAGPDSTYYADVLRLNTAVAPKPAASQGSLGVLDLDVAGFPNGRRLGDDVVDIYMRAAIGGVCVGDFIQSVFDAGFETTATALSAVCPTVLTSAQARLTDRAPISAVSFQSTFPYLNAPVPGNKQGECWRAEGIARQFETNADCDAIPQRVRNGCGAGSKDLSCFCP